MKDNSLKADMGINPSIAVDIGAGAGMKKTWKVTVNGEGTIALKYNWKADPLNEKNVFIQ